MIAGARTLRLGDIEGNIFTFPQEYTDSFSGRRLKLLEFRALLYVILFKKTFTEYFLPPLFALGPAAIWLEQHCA
jgi:hypothetical protein